MKKTIALMLILCMALLTALPVMAEPLPKDDIVAKLSAMVTDIFGGFVTVEPVEETAGSAYYVMIPEAEYNIAALAFSHRDAEGCPEDEINAVMLAGIVNLGDGMEWLDAYTQLYLNVSFALVSAVEGVSFEDAPQPVIDAFTEAARSETGMYEYTENGFLHSVMYMYIDFEDSLYYTLTLTRLPA